MKVYEQPNLLLAGQLVLASLSATLGIKVLA